MNISHPASPHYGKLWSVQDVQNAFAPSAESINTVVEWLVHSGVQPETEGDGWLVFNSTVSHGEEMFRTAYYEHKSPMNNDLRIGCDE